ncbi:MAG TPA: hypothetical protein VK821_20090 [Dehalococcoidia bacterium]|nr:hypothetical protein [Dehalococcoidia bacterium]
MITTEPCLTRAHEEYLAAITANEPEAVLAMLTDDAIYLPPHEPAVAAGQGGNPTLD